MNKIITKIFYSLVIIGFLMSPLQTYAFANNPFGGLVLARIPCKCSDNELIVLAPPLPSLPSLLTFNKDITDIYEFSKVEPNQYVLGTWETKAMCVLRLAGHCVPVPNGPFPFMYMVGTSGGGPEVPPKPQCSDTIDNDGDKLTDMADPGCTSPSDDSESAPECSDGKDNDNNGKTDFAGDDKGCTSADDTTEKSPECSDGIDNDNNGKTDFAGDDKGCTSDEDTRESDAPCACACDGEEEQETRDRLAALGITINRSTACPRNDPNDPCRSTPTGKKSNGKDAYECTDVRCLKRGTVEKLGQLRVATGCTSIKLNGGTEPGHQSHGQCIAIVDLQRQGCLNDYVLSHETGQENSTYGVKYTVPGYGVFLDETPQSSNRHWHINLNG